MPLFDAYIFVDWSAASSAHRADPGPNAVWVGERVPSLNLQDETYHPTRSSGVTHVTERLQHHSADERRVLVGFDFPYGYPAGFAASLALPLGRQSWWTIWKELANRVTDTADNINNRFIAASELNTILGCEPPGPFWACPRGTQIENLTATSPGFPIQCANGVTLQRLRIVEQLLPGTQECWKLYGIGSVGSQALVGIPHVYRLRRAVDFAQFSQVWPFETGFTTNPSPDQGPYVLHAEIWPGLVNPLVAELKEAYPELIKDQAQVRAMCIWAANNDEAGTLNQYFDRPVPLDAQQIQRCVEQEGWVLGAR